MRQRHAQGSAKGLEQRLGDMVRIAATQVVDMQRHTGMINEPLEKFDKEIDVKAANRGTPEIDMELQPRSA